MATRTANLDTCLSAKTVLLMVQRQPNAASQGAIFDSSTGLYFYNARYYDPALGRFIQPDSIVPEPGNPQSFNRYSYVLNNPLRYTDPTGFFTEEAIEGYLQDTYGKEEGNSILAEWKADEAWWKMMRKAEHGDILLVKRGPADVYYAFGGMGDQALYGISRSDGYGNSASASMMMRQSGEASDNATLNEIRKGLSIIRRSPNNSIRKSLNWMARLRWNGDQPSIWARDGYLIAKAEFSTLQREGVRAFWTLGASALALASGLPPLGKLGLAQGNGIAYGFYTDAWHMKPGDVTIYVYPASEGLAKYYRSQHFTMRFRGIPGGGWIVR
jgi:RHS repeat-associated protein